MSTSKITLLTRFEGDLVARTVQVDPTATLGEVAQAAADVTVGRFVPQPPTQRPFIVRESGDEPGPPLDLDMTVSSAGMGHLDCVDVEFAKQEAANV